MTRKLSTWQFVFSMLVLLLLGFIFIGVLYYYLGGNNNFSFKPKEKILSSPVTRPPASLTLTLDSPDNNVLVFDESILVSGKTSANTALILSLNESDQILDINSGGNFSKTLKLEPGVNQLTLSAFDGLGNNKNETRTVYYSKEKI